MREVDYKVAQVEMDPTAVKGDVKVNRDVPMAAVTDDKLARAKERCAVHICFWIRNLVASLLDSSALACSITSAAWVAGSRWQTRSRLARPRAASAVSARAQVPFARREQLADRLWCPCSDLETQPGVVAGAEIREGHADVGMGRDIDGIGGRSACDVAPDAVLPGGAKGASIRGTDRGFDGVLVDPAYEGEIEQKLGAGVGVPGPVAGTAGSARSGRERGLGGEREMREGRYGRYVDGVWVYDDDDEFVEGRGMRTGGDEYAEGAIPEDREMRTNGAAEGYAADSTTTSSSATGVSHEEGKKKGGFLSKIKERMHHH
jgi:hypothetical protein